MDFMNKTPVHRIPGAAVVKENHAKDLTKLTRIELLEIKERESKLLENKKRLQTLPDKGKRIRDYYDKIIAELERRNNIEEAAALFSQLNIAPKGKSALNNLEWNGSMKSEIDCASEDVLDSDDELEMDPLRVLAQQTMHERRVKTENLEKTLITSEDLAEIESFKSVSPDSAFECSESSSSNSTSTSNEATTDDKSTVDAKIIEIDVARIKQKLKPKLEKNFKFEEEHKTDTNGNMLEHVRYLIEKTEKHISPHRDKFKPYKTTITDVHDPAKERARKLGKNWEITAATPPLLKHDKAQCLSLTDSVNIQTQYLSKLKELQTKQAEERLARRMKLMQERKINLPPIDKLKSQAVFLDYRVPESVVIEGEQRFDEEDEIHDPLDTEERGVSYTVYE